MADDTDPPKEGDETKEAAEAKDVEKTEQPSDEEDVEGQKEADEVEDEDEADDVHTDEDAADIEESDLADDVEEGAASDEDGINETDDAEHADDQEEPDDAEDAEDDELADSALKGEPAAPPLASVTGFENTLSPVDLPPVDEGENPRPMLWTSTVIAVAATFLLFFNATAIRGWAYGLTPSERNYRVISVTEGWYSRMETVGFTVPVEAMSGWWDALKAVEFPSAKNGDDTSDTVEDDGDETPPAENTDAEPGFSDL